MKTQNQRILEWMKKHPFKELSPADGFRLFGTMKLSTRIGEIKKQERMNALKIFHGYPYIRSSFKKHKSGAVTKVYWYVT